MKKRKEKIDNIIYFQCETNPASLNELIIQCQNSLKKIKSEIKNFNGLSEKQFESGKQLLGIDDRKILEEKYLSIRKNKIIELTKEISKYKIMLRKLELNKNK